MKLSFGCLLNICDRRSNLLTRTRKLLQIIIFKAPDCLKKKRLKAKNNGIGDGSGSIKFEVNRGWGRNVIWCFSFFSIPKFFFFLPSLVAQLVEKPSAMWETWVRSLGWEDLLEKGKATHSSILDCIVHWVTKSRTSQRLSHHPSFYPSFFRFCSPGFRAEYSQYTVSQKSCSGYFKVQIHSYCINIP